MTTGTLDGDQLRLRVQEMRREGSSPKEISRCLGVRPATVAALVRQIASEKPGPAWEPGLAGAGSAPGGAPG